MRPFLPALLLALSIAACSGAQTIPQDARQVVVSLQRIDCADCGEEIVAALRERPGVYEASFDKRSAEVRVTASPTFDVYTEVKRLAALEGFEAKLGAGQGRYQEGSAFPPGADVITVVKDGADLPSLENVTVRGKVTVVDFSAGWCGPCRVIDQHMAKVLGQNDRVAYRKLDIGDWDSPLAQRYLKDVPKLPYVIVFDPNGVKVGAIAGADLGGLDAAISKSLPKP